MTDEDLTKALTDAGFTEEHVKALFNSRDNADDGEVPDYVSVDSEDNEAEAKYNHAAVTALIKSIVETTKEIHVR